MLACGPDEFPAGTAPVEAASGERRVVVIVLDGVRLEESLGDGVSSATGAPSSGFLPGVRRSLVPRGALISRAIAVGPTATAEGHAGLLTGRRLHQSTFPTGDGVGVYRPLVPTVFEAARAHLGLSAEQVVLLSNTVHLESHTHGLHPSGSAGATWRFAGDAQPESDAAVLQRLGDLLIEDNARLVLANLHGMDAAGHFGGEGDYPLQVEAIDAPLVALWERITDAGLHHDVTLVITADHGRHRWSDPGEQDYGYQHHTDQCAGCREIPLLLLGAGVAVGIDSDVPATLEDVGATVARLLDVPLPHAHGVPISEALAGGATPNVGEIAPAAAGGVEAWQILTGDRQRPSEVVVDGAVRSSDGALLAEAPAVLAEPAVACWRELSVGAPGEVAHWAWRPRCLLRTDDQEELSLPLTVVAPDQVPALATDDRGDLLMATVDNPNANWEARDQGVMLLRWTSGLWMEGRLTDVVDPADVAMVYDRGAALVAFTTSRAADERARLTRHVRLYAVDVESPATWSLRYDSGDLAEQGMLRMHSPAVHASGGGVSLAFIAHGADGAASLVEVQADQGAPFGEPVTVGRGVLGHVQPVYDDGALVWARWDGGPVVCRDAICVEVDAAAIGERLVPVEGGVRLATADASGWAIVDLMWPTNTSQARASDRARGPL